jgi:hypothetical protein
MRRSELMSFHKSKRVEKTRKPHRCFWCGDMTEVGLPSLREVGQWEGDFWSGYMHVECGMARDAVLKEYGEWSAKGQYARGRTDDDRDKPPEFDPFKAEADRINVEDSVKSLVGSQCPNCAGSGEQPLPKLTRTDYCGLCRGTGIYANAGVVPRRGSDVGTSPLLAVSESGKA